MTSIAGIKMERSLFYLSCRRSIWGISNEILAFFDGDYNCIYSSFHRLMDKLYDEYKDEQQGFWCNRDILLTCVRDMTIVFDAATKDIVGFYVIRELDDDGPDIIDFFQSFQPGQGIGRKMVEHECMRRSLCVLEPMPESIGFWEALGVPLKRDDN